MVSWHVYMIRTRAGTLYAGIATDVERRLEEHRGAARRGSRYLRGRGPLTLAYRVRIGDRALALKVEWRIKRLTKGKKEQLVAARPPRRRLLALLKLDARSLPGK